MRVILIHGYKATSKSGFFPWLERELRARDFDVVIPELPNPEEPDRDVWTETLVKTCAPLKETDIIVGHSLGGAAALRMLEAAEARSTPHAMVMISTPWMIKDDKFRGFFMSELDFEVLMWRASKFVVIHALNDSIIPVDHAKRYASVFHAKLVTPETGEHFQGEEYPIILQSILDVAAEPIVYEPGKSLADDYAEIR
ncbi:MAG: alpha/beta fold hydrolase [Patescibacteria group bacterium]